jgi:hypothetical protein
MLRALVDGTGAGLFPKMFDDFEIIERPSFAQWNSKRTG